MSFKAIWNNRNRPRKCSTDKSVCGTMSGYGIPSGMVQYHTFMLIRNPDGRKNVYGGYSDFYHLDPPEYGKIMTQEEADKLDIASGRCNPVFRNSTRFVQSRAARKRGYKCEDFRYLARVNQK